MVLGGSERVRGGVPVESEDPGADGGGPQGVPGSRAVVIRRAGMELDGKTGHVKWSRLCRVCLLPWSVPWLAMRMRTVARIRRSATRPCPTPACPLWSGQRQPIRDGWIEVWGAKRITCCDVPRTERTDHARTPSDGGQLMRRGFAIAAVVTTVLMTTGMASSTAQAAQSSAPDSWCGEGWTFSPVWGASAGHPCWSPAEVQGWVLDREADSQCVIMRFHWFRDGRLIDSQGSPAACGPGTYKEFTLQPAGKEATWVNWQFLRV